MAKQLSFISTNSKLAQKEEHQDNIMLISGTWDDGIVIIIHDTDSKDTLKTQYEHWLAVHDDMITLGEVGAISKSKRIVSTLWDYMVENDYCES